MGNENFRLWMRQDAVLRDPRLNVDIFWQFDWQLFLRLKLPQKCVLCESTQCLNDPLNSFFAQVVASDISSESKKHQTSFDYLRLILTEQEDLLAFESARHQKISRVETSKLGSQ